MEVMDDLTIVDSPRKEAAGQDGLFRSVDCYKNLKSGISSVFATQSPQNYMNDAMLMSKRMYD